MRKDTRYNIAHAKRNHVAVGQVPPGEAEINTFYRLLRETSKRSGFGIHSRAYYKDFLDVFGDQAVLLLARVDGVATAGRIAGRAGVEARSMYAGASHAHRSRGDAALLRFNAMQWARENGCSRYDLGGIDPTPRRPDQAKIMCAPARVSKVCISSKLDLEVASSRIRKLSNGDIDHGSHGWCVA